MTSFIRKSHKAVLLALVGVAVSVRAWSAPDANTPVPSPAPSASALPAPTPAGPPHAPFPLAGSPMAPDTSSLPKFLEGVITLEEYQSYEKFQQAMNDDPEGKELLGKVIELRKQMMQLQRQLSQRRAQAMEEHPEMKAIALKMQQAMFTRGPMGPHASGPGASPVPAPGPGMPVPTTPPKP